MKIYVAGHKGLVGSAIVKNIQTQQKHTWVGMTRDQLDLLNRELVFSYIEHETPDAVIIAAAKVGGIKANSSYPVEFLSQNLQIQNNIIDACATFNIERVVFLGSSCVYPRMSPQPIKEEYLLTGELEKTNEAYAIAKIAGLKLIQAHRTEYQRRWISAMPTNLYGPGDNFDLEESHVLPALIRKFHEAKVTGSNSVQLWGSGTPKREFLYVDDLASASIFLLEHYDGDLAINVGSGLDISIRDLAALVGEIIGFNGETLWDTDKPDGTPRKILDSSRLQRLGWSPKVGLRQGIEMTYQDYKKALKDF